MRNIFYALLTIATLLGSYVGAWALVDVRDYIDIQDVYIHQTVAGEPVELDVIRFIHKDFEGGYRVELRQNSHSFCSTGDIELGYKADSILKDPLHLSYWASGGSCTGLIPEQLYEGLYSVRTCHFVSNPLYILPRKELCNVDFMEVL